MKLTLSVIFAASIGLVGLAVMAGCGCGHPGRIDAERSPQQQEASDDALAAIEKLWALNYDRIEDQEEALNVVKAYIEKHGHIDILLQSTFSRFSAPNFFRMLMEAESKNDTKNYDELYGKIGGYVKVATQCIKGMDDRREEWKRLDKPSQDVLSSIEREAYYVRGIAYMHLNEPEKAKKDLECCLTILPDEPHPFAKASLDGLLAQMTVK